MWYLAQNVKSNYRKKKHSYIHIIVRLSQIIQSYAKKPHTKCVRHMCSIVFKISGVPSSPPPSLGLRVSELVHWRLRPPVRTYSLAARLSPSPISNAQRRRRMNALLPVVADFYMADWGSVHTTPQPIDIPTHFVRMYTMSFWTKTEKKNQRHMCLFPSILPLCL